MADLTPQQMAGKLLAGGFAQGGNTTPTLTDPITDTTMVVTLDELRPYELNPRMTRNPLYDEIKASIRERGLDATPAITRRPGADHYIICNGGNTRLAILHELWSETRDERFFRIACLFRPWPERGEIVALTGHLAENELRGGLTFIERALGIEKAREFYEEEDGKSISQSALARRLREDGFPVQQSHISRMQDAVRYLLPAIPGVLYAGLGRHQIERLAVIRKACSRAWEQYAKKQQGDLDFEGVFQDVLAQFDSEAVEFSTQRVQDELIGQMAEILDVDYDVLALFVNESETRHRALVSEPEMPVPSPSTADTTVSITRKDEVLSEPRQLAEAVEPEQGRESVQVDEQGSDPVPGHIVTPAPTTERLESIQRMVAAELGDEVPPCFKESVLQSIPVQAGGLYPISDVWYIEPALDTPKRLRSHIAQFAREIAAEGSQSQCIEDASDGIGFSCLIPEEATPSSHAILVLLASLGGRNSNTAAPEGSSIGALAALLHGRDPQIKCLSDTALVKLFRLIRLARRLLELESGDIGSGGS